MSKGGAGKVYFVLYLAVILELLIIIVERDEAEEHLIQKQKESMRIVESILAQLQTGSGTEGISTQSKDEITLQDPGAAAQGGPKITQDRTYFIEVGVTDVFGADKVDRTQEGADEKIRNLIKLANVQQLEYQIFYHPSEGEATPSFPVDDSLRNVNLNTDGQIVGDVVDGGNWRLVMLREITLDDKSTKEWKLPLYKDYSPDKIIGSIQAFAPPKAIAVDSMFRYSQFKTDELSKRMGGKIKKRVFEVHFNAPQRPGWYKLRFASKTNRILGISGDIKNGDDVPDDAKVNIGTVQLKVKDLRVVRKELTKKLEGTGVPAAEDLASGKITNEQFVHTLETAKEKVASTPGGTAEGNSSKISQIELYGYIARLLAPGKSDLFPQNRSSISVDIRVIKPEVNIADPYVELPPAVYDFDKLKPAFTFTSGPFQGNNQPEARITTPAGPVAVTLQPIDASADASGSSSARGGKRTYRAIASRALDPGKYTIEVTQRNANKTKTEQTTLEVFATKLDDVNEQEVSSAMNRLYYGNTFRVNLNPASGGKISAGQFRAYLTTDKDQQKTPARSLSSSLELPAAANNVSLRLSWVSPYTDEEVTVYENSKPIKQLGPEFDQSRVTTRQATLVGKKLKVESRDFVILPVSVDAGSKESTPKDIENLKVDKVTGSIDGFEIMDQSITDQGDGHYTILIELNGAAPRGQKEINGSLTVAISAQVKNPVNGKLSDTESIDFDVLVNTEVAPKKKTRR